MIQDLKAVEVTQADRDAAAAYWKSQGIGTQATYRTIKNGGRDDSDLVQAFARHRLDALSSQSPPQDGRGALGAGAPQVSDAIEKQHAKTEVFSDTENLAATPPQDGDEVERAALIDRLTAYRNDWHARMGDVGVLDEAISALRSGGGL